MTCGGALTEKHRLSQVFRRNLQGSMTFGDIDDAILALSPVLRLPRQVRVSGHTIQEGCKAEFVIALTFS
jgi:hypothetical protein